MFTQRSSLAYLTANAGTPLPVLWSSSAVYITEAVSVLMGSVVKNSAGTGKLEYCP